MKKILLSLCTISMLFASCKKNNNNNISATRTFNGTAFNTINMIATTTVNSNNESVAVTITYANDDGSTYRDTVKVFDINGVMQLSSVNTRTKGSVNNLNFAGLPKDKSYTCMFIRNGNASYPDTLITISGN